MLFKTRTQKGIWIFVLFGVIVGVFLIAKEGMKGKPVNDGLTMIPIERADENVKAKIELAKEPVRLIGRTDVLQNLLIPQGEITSLGEDGIKHKGPSFSEAPMETMAEPTQIIDDQVSVKFYEAAMVQIGDAGGEPITNLFDESGFNPDQNGMVKVENMNRPQDVDFRPRPVKALAQEGLESEELKILEETRQKRKSNFAETLEESEMRKKLYRIR